MTKTKTTISKTIRSTERKFAQRKEDLKALAFKLRNHSKWPNLTAAEWKPLALEHFGL